MRWLALLSAAALACSAEQWTLYTCMATTKTYFVGAKLPPSGAFKRLSNGEWKQVGHPNPFAFSLDYDRRDPSKIYVAAGNGIIRLKPNASDWKILTGSDVTEMRDVVVAADGSVYYGNVTGVYVSRDGGATWRQLAKGYTESIRIDRTRAGVLLAGKENGVYRSEDDGRTWKLAGVDGFSIMRIEQSPHDGCLWFAATERGGLFASHDCGQTFENSGHIGVDRVLYDISFDPAKAGRVAIAGWGFGVAVSEDSGKTWQFRNDGLPQADVWSVAFDPGHAGRLYAGVHEQAIFMSDDAGKTWKNAGLDGTVAYRLRFVPEVQ